MPIVLTPRRFSREGDDEAASLLTPQNLLREMRWPKRLPDAAFQRSACLTPSVTWSISSQEGGCGQPNCAVKRPYRRSFPFQVVYYRQSCSYYLAKNCADNGTVPITRRSDVE